MVPIRPSDASLGVSNIVGNKHAQPPHPEAPPPNPSLVKALDAVIAAGRRGLLGPAGRVAAESVPALNVDPARVDKRKKVVNQKRTAVITVECSAEAVEKARYCKSATCTKGNMDMWEFCDLDIGEKSAKSPSWIAVGHLNFTGACVLAWDTEHEVEPAYASFA
ncbi:hypothetical protein NXF25_005623 [Crotalus adamanteus]|uniref:Uncharacterized protein n=1 Tax=Crotalus adamanteus TaxID=8729 RepID=A0AAW1BX83_CROAD